MDAYSGFAAIYDMCMDNIPYDSWSEYLCSLLQSYGIHDGIVAELGCGTGEMTIRLRKSGYDMIGIDSSPDMLEIARDKGYELLEEPDILYLLQDIRELELFGTVKAFVSVCDTMNYLLTESDVLKTLRLVNNYLERDGVFIFDLKTAYYFEHVLGDETRVEHWEDGTIVWENAYDALTSINQYDLTIYARAGEKSDLYEQMTETHMQRAYSISQIKELIAEAGMECMAVYDAFTMQPATERSERIYIIAKEGFQQGKQYV